MLTITFQKPKNKNKRNAPKTYFFGDDRKQFQFSKVLTFCAVTISLISILLFTIASMIFSIDSTIVVTSIGLLGSICITSLVWSLKKSQAENTTRLYLEMYREIIKLKRNSDEDENGISDAKDFINQITSNTESQMTGNLDNIMSDATSLIERQDI